MQCKECEHYWFDEDGYGSPSYDLTSKGTCVKCRVPGDKADLCRTCNGDKPTQVR